MKIRNNTIKILSINVGRSSSAHQIALQVAFTSHIDILLIQEPYISRDIQRKITCKHPSFECFTPADDWTIRPRVLTYTRKNSNLTYTQYRPNSTQEYGKEDILFLIIKGPDRLCIQIVNIYNVPPGAIDPVPVSLFFLHFKYNSHFKINSSRGP